MERQDAASDTRYAICYAPEPLSPLWRFGSRWLGWDADNRKKTEPLCIDGIAYGRIASITQMPRKYGFHATLKPPFQLAPGYDLSMLDESLEAFAVARRAFKVPALELAALDGFVALLPQETCPTLEGLAADCVCQFDPFRATDGELPRKAEMTSRQKTLCETWGSAYVMEEYRFHMKLTEPLVDVERRTVLECLRDHAKMVCKRKPWHFGALTLMRQKGPDEPFHTLKRYPIRTYAPNRGPWKSRWPVRGASHPCAALVSSAAPADGH